MKIFQNSRETINLLSQRAKQFWLRDGDKNTRFFHKYATALKEHNKTKELQDDSGEWKVKDLEVHEVIINYFQDIFKTSSSGEIVINRVQMKQLDEEQKKSRSCQ